MRESAVEALQSIVLKQSDQTILRRLLRLPWWSVTDSPEVWKAMDRADQRLAVVEAAERPATEIITHAQTAIAVGAFLAALGLLLFGLGQDVVSNLLADQLGPHVPPGLQGALTLVGLGVFLGGLALLLQRQLSRWAS